MGSGKDNDGRKEVCPYYRSGICISPKLRVPTGAVTNGKRCLESFRSCSLYDRRREEERKGLGAFIVEDNSKKEGGTKLESGCEYFFIVDGRAKCKVLGRALTSDVVKNCVRYWQTCPYRALAGAGSG